MTPGKRRTRVEHGLHIVRKINAMHHRRRRVIFGNAGFGAHCQAYAPIPGIAAAAAINTADDQHLAGAGHRYVQQVEIFTRGKTGFILCQRPLRGVLRILARPQ